ncbi:MAG TPA: FtsX-like permease family protein [Blastocatellia bacterium]|nr:FtsX-like permease family protein [Blastocatellia bacterium]
MVPLGFGGHSYSGTRIEGYTPAADEQVSIERVNISYVVSQRKREIAIRMAIGASPRSVVNLILRQGMALALIGLVIRSLAAFAAGQMLRSQLLGVSPGDPITFASVALLLSAVALLACLLPAWRASRTDPAESLKAE